MKKLTIEYLGYKLEIEIKPCNYSVYYPHIEGICHSLSFVKKGYYGNYLDIIDEFIKVVDKKYKEEARNEALAVLD